jgi:hypothetical protein
VIRLLLSIALGLACGGAFLLLTRPTLPYIIAAALVASVLAAIFSEASTPRNSSTEGATNASGAKTHEEQSRAVDW